MKVVVIVGAHLGKVLTVLPQVVCGDGITPLPFTTSLYLGSSKPHLSPSIIKTTRNPQGKGAHSHSNLNSSSQFIPIFYPCFHHTDLAEVTPVSYRIKEEERNC